MTVLGMLILLTIVILIMYVDSCVQRNPKRLDLSKVQFMYCIYEEQRYYVIDLKVKHRLVYVLDDKGDKQCLPMCKCELLIQEVRK